MNLEECIAKYQSAGWILTAKTEKTAQFKKQKKFSCLWFIFFGIFYLIYHFARREPYIAMNDISGEVYINNVPIATYEKRQEINRAVFLSLGLLLTLFLIFSCILSYPITN